MKVCENRTETKLKHKYPNSIAVCDDNYIGKKEFSRVFQIIKDIENPESIINQQDSLVPIRKVLESIFKKLYTIGLIPNEIQNEGRRAKGYRIRSQIGPNEAERRSSNGNNNVCVDTNDMSTPEVLVA